MVDYSYYNPTGTTRTTFRGRARHLPLLPNYFNHQWFEEYIDDFLEKNHAENNGVISGCVISQDGGNNAINTSSGVVYVNGTKVTISAAGPYALSDDGWYVSYITSGGAIVHGYLSNSTVQGAVTPEDAIIIGYSLLGNGVLYIISFYNTISETESSLFGKTEHIHPDIVVGPSLTNQRVTNLETTFIAALADGDKLLFIDGVGLTASREITTDVKFYMDNPDTEIDIGAYDLTLSGESSGDLYLTGTGSLILNGVCHALVIKGTGFIIEEGASFSGSYFDNGNLHLKGQDIQYLDQPDMVVMTTSELANYSESEKYVSYDPATKLFKTKGDVIRTPITGDWTKIKSIEELTANLEFPDTYLRPKIDVDRHFVIPLGDQGGGVPYPIIIHGNNGEIDLITDQDFSSMPLPSTLDDATLEQWRYIKNRGFKNRIWLNRKLIFSGDVPTFFFTPVELRDPYILYENGNWNNGIPDLGSNDGENCFCDMWKYLGGSQTLQIGPCWNPLDSPSNWKYLTTAADGGRFIRPVSLGDGTVDPNPHTRTHPLTLGSATTISTYTSSASAEISGISDADILKVKVGCRVYDAGENIPQYGSGTPKTTVISKIVHNDTDDNSIFLIDSESRDPVSVTSSGDLTIDWGGNTGISYAVDAFQQFQIGANVASTVYYGVGADPGNVNSGNTQSGYAISKLSTGSQGSSSGLYPFDDGTNGTPRAGSQTQPISVNRFGAWKQ